MGAGIAALGAVAGLFLAVVFSGSSGIAKPAVGSAQAIANQASSSKHDSVVRLSNRDISEAALKVAVLDPLANLDDNVGVVSSLAEMGDTGAFINTDPAFTVRIDAPDIDIAMASLASAYSVISERDAAALDFAVRFLAVTKLKGSDFAAYGQDPSAIPDAALFKHILPLINGKTPMQIMIVARNEQERIAKEQEAIPADPFDRIEMQRSGQMPGITIPR